MGRIPNASGPNPIAVNKVTDASQSLSIAMGRVTIASIPLSNAVGRLAAASGVPSIIEASCREPWALRCRLQAPAVGRLLLDPAKSHPGSVRQRGASTPPHLQTL